MEKGKCKPLRGLLDGHRDYFSLFEDDKPPVRQVEVEKSEIKKERLKKDKLVKHLIKQKEDSKQCKCI